MNNDEQRFTGMVRQHKGTIYTVCYMFSQDADEVSDLFQEALVRLWQGFEGFEGHSDVRTWIYRVTLNTCISMDRKRRSRQALPLEMDINLFEDRDEDTLQVNLLHRRIGRLRPPRNPGADRGSDAGINENFGKQCPICRKYCIPLPSKDGEGIIILNR